MNAKEARAKFISYFGESVADLIDSIIADGLKDFGWRVKNWKTREWKYYRTREEAVAACGELDTLRQITFEKERKG